MLNQLQIHRQILYDLVVHYLEPMSGVFERLGYLAGLRDSSSEHYAHSKLEAVYGEGPVDEALLKCHEELFERLLELSLAEQEKDFLLYLDSLSGGRKQNVESMVAKSRTWMPGKVPDYLKDLYSSNLTALAEMLRENKPKGRSGT